MEAKNDSLKQQLEIIYRPHPVLPSVDCKFAKQEWVKGLTVRQILIANGVDQHQPIVIVVNDRLLTVKEWDTVCPDPGSIINVKAEVAGGGGDGNKVLNTVLMIALVVAVIALQQYELLPVIMGGQGIAAAGLMIAGSLIINALVPILPPSAATLDTTSGSNNETSPTYSISGGQNSLRPYQSMPIVMGTHRFFPDFGSKPYTEYRDSDQYLYQIFNFGLSGIQTSEFKIGTTPLSSYSDYQWFYGDQYGRINQFPGNVDSQVGAALTNDAGWIYRTTSTNTYRIGIDISGVLYYANDRGGLDNTSVSLRVQYKPVGTGTWLDPTSITCTGTGFANGYYENYSYYVEQGYWNYDENGYENEWIDTSYYETRTRFVANVGNQVIISGNSQAPRRSTLFIDVGVGTYDVRIIRDTADSTDSRLQNKVSFDTLRSYQLDNANYSGQHRTGLVIRASEQLNGAIQQLSCLAEAKAVFYGTDYAAYVDNYADLLAAFIASGQQDKYAWGKNHYLNYGQFEGRTAPPGWAWDFTSNPAHWFTYFALGSKDQNGKLKFGVGLSQSQIDVAGLTAWANFCATEGLTFNAVFDGSQTAADVLTAISRCGFASPSWSSGKLGVVWDGRNQSPVAQFGMGNIVKGSFNVSYATESLADEIIVRFVNPNKDWEQDEVRVTVPGVTDANNPTTVDLMGCTSQSMAGKMANYIAAQQYYRKRRISWDTDFEGFVCQRGDVVLLSHDLTQWGYSGRIVSIDGNEVTIDREVPRSGAIEYFMIRKPNGDMTTYQVVAGTGSSNVLTLTTTPLLQSDYLEVDHLWSFSPLATPGKKVKIISVQPKSESLLTITATDENPEFYAAWDGAYNVPAKSSLLLNSIPVISNVQTTEMIYRGNDNAIKSKIAVTWDVKGLYDRCNVRYKTNNGVWTSVTVNGNRFEFDTQDTGSLDINIVAITGVTATTPFNYSGQIYGATLSVANVTNLNDFFRDGRTVLRWDLLTDPRLIEYEIRKGTDWDKAQIIARVVNNEFATDGDGTYWVAARTTGAIYSPTPVSIVIEGSTLVANVVATYDEEATGWSGTLSGGAALDTSTNSIKLVGDPIPSEGSYEIPASHIVDVGTAQPCSVSVSYRMAADSPFNLVSLIPVFSEIPSLVGKYAGDADVKIQIAIAPDSGVFGDWRAFIPGTYVGRKFKMRALLYSYDAAVTPVLDQLVFTVDMPDRLERGTNISATAGGITVTYDTEFQIVPNVQVTIVNAQANDDIVITNETEAGFDVKIINGASNVTRTINWIAQGY